MATTTAAPVGPPPPPDQSQGSWPSFKDKLLQWRTGVSPYRANDGFQLAEDDIQVEMKRDGPSFWFSERFRSHIACPWVFSVITMVLARRFSYRMICSKVASLWKPQRGFQTWQPGFDVSKEPSKTVVWVQIAELPVEWYRQDILSALAQQMDKPIRIDINTLEAERAKFARLAIEVEFTKALLGWVEIEGRWFKVCYEDIPDFCFHCGLVGHVVSQYPTAREQSPPSEHQPRQGTDGDSAAGSGSDRCSGNEVSARFGTWMRISRQPRVPYSRGSGLATKSSGKSAGASLAVNPFELGSATALLKEVMRDAMDGPSSLTMPVASSLVFSSPAMAPVVEGQRRNNLKNSKGRKSSEVNVEGSKKDSGQQQEELTEVTPIQLKRKVQVSKVDPKATVNPLVAGIPKQFRKANGPLMDSNVPSVQASIDVKTMGGAYVGREKSDLFSSSFRDIVQQNRVHLAVILEPRISSPTAERVIQTLGFPAWVREDARGFAGGIWILWRPELLHVSVVQRFEQFLHVRVSPHGRSPFFLSAVYASPSESRQSTLWPRPRDPGSPGSMVCCDVAWIACLQMMAGGFVSRRPRVKSDHRPILLREKPQNSGLGAPRLFRFQAAWLTHSQFTRLVQDSWPNGVALIESITSFREAVQVWNRNCFGNVFQQKRRLLQRLKGVELALDRCPNRYLSQLEKRLRSEYEQVLVREELIWMQKSRCKWLHLGDHNTHFFHLTTKARRRKNRIEALMPESGDWVYEPCQLKHMAIQFFAQLYAEEGSPGYV
ncbi:hypothetical protein Tsubulata_027740 [Turnera subulata]|uniref:DUF4283 domain-containing protein n=1 Tax=Turnera subulata TaxID=218843 RepID=A0A9Q0JCZ4_9ROSI|nr:hypothetical protein Tsubulata_027740 [Turnera subulata]